MKNSFVNNGTESRVDLHPSGGSELLDVDRDPEGTLACTEASVVVNDRRAGGGEFSGCELYFAKHVGAEKRGGRRERRRGTW